MTSSLGDPAGNGRVRAEEFSGTVRLAVRARAAARALGSSRDGVGGIGSAGMNVACSGLPYGSAGNGVCLTFDRPSARPEPSRRVG